MNWFRTYFLFFPLLLGFLNVAGVQRSFAFFPTSESDCAKVDLREQFPLKLRNQGGIGWCYAHTAADYLQYFFKIDDQISAADIAIQYNLRKWPRFLRLLRGDAVPQTGFIRGAMFDALESGYCPEKYFPSEEWVKQFGPGNKKGRIETQVFSNALTDLFQLQEWVQSNFYLNASELPFSFKFSDVTSDQFFELLKSTSHKNILNELRLAACSNHRVDYPPFVGGIGMRLKGPRVFMRLNNELNQANPVAVDYFYGVLEDNNVFEVSLSELHTSLLYGRRFNQNTSECQYLIKNSYGRFCHGQHYDPRNDCEGGYLWVSEGAFYSALMSYEIIRGDIVSQSDVSQIPDEQDSQSD